LSVTVKNEGESAATEKQFYGDSGRGPSQRRAILRPGYTMEQSSIHVLQREASGGKLGKAIQS